LIQIKQLSAERAFPK